MRVAIVVLGDFGRSPRMQYHALALADSLADVDVIAYEGSAPFAEVRKHPRIRFHPLRAPQFAARHRLWSPLFAAYAIARVAAQSLRLAWLMLFKIRKPDMVLVQNPPPLPTMLVALVAARLRSARLVIDWHNFGYSMLALRMGEDRLAVRMTRWCERTFGRFADAHLCVSGAMRSELEERWSISATVLYDRPAKMFAPAAPAMRHELFRRIRDQINFPLDGIERPAILVCPTSWTADEDFLVLIDAALRCDELIRLHDERSAGSAFPHLLIIITGQGPLRAAGEREIRRLALRKVHLRTAWLTAEDYAVLLGSADAGLCCHRSASGVDLPMKLADLWGAGLPVLALDYGPCLGERIRHGGNGLLFTDGAQLAGELYDLFKEFPAKAPLLEGLRSEVAKIRTVCWSDGWKAEAESVLLQQDSAA